MFGLVTMQLTTLGATGMGSMLKIVRGIVQSINDAKEAKAKRELIRDMSMSNANVEFQKAVLEKLIKIPLYSLVLLVGLLLLSGCLTSQRSPSGARCTPILNSSPSLPQKTKKTGTSYGDSYHFHLEAISPHRLVLDTSL